MPKTVDYYLSRGFDRTTAEYFAAGRKKAVGVRANDDFTLLIDFDNGERRILDVRPLCEQGTVFARLRSLELFRRVYIDEVHSVAWDIDENVDSREVWNNKIDLCSDTCYLDSRPYMPLTQSS